VTLHEVEAAVLKKAQAEAESLLVEARRLAEERWQRESVRLREEHRRRLEHLRVEEEAALAREVAAKRAEHRRALLARKNEILDEVFHQAAEAIITLPDDGYRCWLEAQLLRVVRLTQGDESAGEVLTNDRDHTLVGRLLTQLTPGARLTLAAERVPIRGGFLVRGRRWDLDLSLDSLLAQLRETLAEKVATALFGGESAA